MDNQSKKHWVLVKFKRTVFFLWLFFILAKLIGMFVNVGREFFRKEYMETIQNILFCLPLVICFFEIKHSWIYDKEGTIKRLKELLTKKRIIDLLIPVIFGLLLMTIYFCSRSN